MSFNALSILLLPVIFFGHQAASLQPVKLVSPIADRAYAFEEAQPGHVEEKTPTQQSIANEIREVFGQDADKAFKLLSCENSSLNPKAINHNSDAVHSTDFGTFQINNHWQGVTNTAFLTDYHINIRMAYNIYVHHGYHFDAWTCGRKLGI